MKWRVLKDISLLILLTAFCTNNKNKNSSFSIIKEQNVTKRIGMVIGIKSEAIEEYKRLHSDDIPGVRDLLKEANIVNFSIFIHQFDDGKYYLFGYYEYTGEDYEKEMAKLAGKERNIEWLKVCDPLQIPFEGQNSWSEMEKIYYLE